MKKFILIGIILLFISIVIFLANYKNDKILTITKNINTKTISSKKEKYINVVGEEQIAEE